MMQLSGVRILNGSFPVSGSLSGVWFREGFICVPRTRIFFVEGLRSSGFRVEVLVLITASTTAFKKHNTKTNTAANDSTTDNSNKSPNHRARNSALGCN